MGQWFCGVAVNQPISIPIKPMTVNSAWKGKRYKTDAYKRYEHDVLLLLPRAIIPEGCLRLCIEAGFSNKQADIDNVAKPFIDILQKKYGFNDCQIYELNLNKQIVDKGKEYIRFRIDALEKVKSLINRRQENV